MRKLKVEKPFVDSDSDDRCGADIEMGIDDYSVDKNTRVQDNNNAFLDMAPSEQQILRDTPRMNRDHTWSILINIHCCGAINLYLTQ